MEHASGIMSSLLTVVVLGMAAALVSRRRKHLRLVCRVVDQKDRKIIGFLDDLIQNGQLTPASA